MTSIPVSFATAPAHCDCHAADYRPRPFDILLRRRGCGLFITLSDGTSVLCRMPRFENLEVATRKGVIALQVCAVYDSDFG
jgi:hypothetical protein